MNYEELAPHLNKIATLYLKNNKRKVGWLFIDIQEIESSGTLEDVYFVCLQKGRKLSRALESNDVQAVYQANHHEKIPLREIVRVRSTL